MYSFGPLPKYRQSGRVIGTHQKIDRVARRHLQSHLEKELRFPSISEILHFEGYRGPDGVKLKSPGSDEPWHFVDPKNMNVSDKIFVSIEEHSKNLSVALEKNDQVRAAFEAAWLAHAVTDGLTPAHHEPLHEQMEHMHSEDESRRRKVRGKIVMSGQGSSKKFIKNNWDYWGAKGLMTTHTLFEAGVATAAKPLRFNDAQLTDEDFDSLKETSFSQLYMNMITQVDQLDMYENFKSSGWTRTLAKQTNQELVPVIVKAVTLAWYDAYMNALKEDA